MAVLRNLIRRIRGSQDDPEIFPIPHPLLFTRMVKPGVREDIVQSAVRFLQDAKVQESPLAKRIAFLESKGLSADEIEEAMSRASGSGSASPGSVAVASAGAPPPLPPPNSGGYVQYPGYPPAGYPQYPPPPPPAQPYNWKDYTLGAIGAIGAGYGAYALAKRYLAPLLSFPTEQSLKASNAEIASHLETTSTVIEAVKAETSDVMKAVDAQAVKVNEALEGMVETLKSLRESDERRDKELEELKTDVDSIREMIPKMLDKSKDSQTAVISDLQTEIKSLKNLLLNRRLPMSSTPPSQGGLSTPSPSPLDASSTQSAEPAPVARPGFPSIPSKPAIPAWQLQQQQQQEQAESSMGTSSVESQDDKNSSD